MIDVNIDFYLIFIHAVSIFDCVDLSLRLNLFLNQKYREKNLKNRLTFTLKILFN